MNTIAGSNQTVLLQPEVSDMTQKLREEVEALKERKFGLRRQYVIPEQRSLQKAQLKEIDSELKYKTKLLKASRLYEPYKPQNTWFAGWVKKPFLFSNQSVFLGISFAVLGLLAVIVGCKLSDSYYHVLAIAVVGCIAGLSYAGFCLGLRNDRHGYSRAVSRVGHCDSYYELTCRIFRQLLPVDVASRYREAERQGLFDEILVFAPDENVFQKTIVVKVDPILAGRVYRKDTKEDQYFLITALNLSEDFDHLGV
ncbi:MAG: hypothetical protein HZA36_01880 [Parcubacteria group bacterium]|nr:hypothetical protein [Parcubacteria group bacterium]